MYLTQFDSPQCNALGTEAGGHMHVGDIELYNRYGRSKAFEDC